MLCRVSLAIAVLSFWGACGSVRADPMSRLVMPRDYGVKLCGREFIRAVIFTCGGSRWRRSAQVDSESSRWSSLTGAIMEDNQYTWRPSQELTGNSPPRRPASSYSLADLLALYRGQQQQQSPGDPAQLEGPQPVWGERRGIPAEGHVESKRKRNFSLGVAGKCCSQGCSKNDIGRLC